MNKIIDIHFIINPIAGSGNTILSESFLEFFFPRKRYRIKVKPSQYKGNSILLTQRSIAEGADIIVACGGDGTVNEVASTLIGSDIPLGIIPIGSGNGLASNLKIPKNIEAAIAAIKTSKIEKIDVGCLNEHYFFSNTGFGFDASVIKYYEASEKRTLSRYVKASIKSFKHYHKQSEVRITIDDKPEIVSPFLIFISNSNELGYHVSLTPKASLKDGLLDIVIVPQINKLKILLFSVLVLFNKHTLLKEVSCFQTAKMTISRGHGDYFQSQLDGEFFKIEEKTVQISIKPKSLHVIVS